MSLADYLGLVAGGIVTVGLVPQVMRVYKLKSARDISFLFNLSLLSGMIMFLVYGVILELFPLILWNSIGMLLLIALLFGKWKYGR
jgi:MtN3 and saliva related transmembrane protein